MLSSSISHIYLALLALFQAFQYAIKREAPSVTCPNCNTRVRTKAKSSWFDRSQRRNGPYSALGDDEYRDDAEAQVAARRIVEPAMSGEDEAANKGQGKGKATEEPSLSPVDE